MIEHEFTKVKISLDDITSQQLYKRFIAFDVETTGLNPENDRIIEVGAVLFEKGQIVKRFSTLVNPDILIPPAATAVNHITNDMIKDAPEEKDVYPKLIEFLGDALSEGTIIAAHNAYFDLSFFSESLKRLGYSGSMRYIDTLSLSRKLLKDLPDYKQTTLADYFGLVNVYTHRADNDAEVCGKILLELLNLYQNRGKEERVKSKQTVSKMVPPIKREEVVIAPVHNRVPLTKIKHSRDALSAFCDGYPYWEEGERLRKKGKYREAISHYNLARENGYADAMLYDSYASAYHNLLDYDNEIDILDEGISRLTKLGRKTARLESKRNKALYLLYKEQTIS